MGVPSTLAVKLQSQFQTDEKGHCTDEIRIYSHEQDTPNWSAHILYSGIVEASQEAMWKHFAGPVFSVHNPFHLAKCGLCRVLLVPLHARLFPQLFTVSPRTNETIILIHTWSKNSPKWLKKQPTIQKVLSGSFAVQFCSFQRVNDENSLTVSKISVACFWEWKVSDKPNFMCCCFRMVWNKAENFMVWGEGSLTMGKC